MFEKMPSSHPKEETLTSEEQKEKDLLEAFSLQFQRRETIPFLNTRGIEAIDVSPEGAKETPVLFVAGWASDFVPYREAIWELFKSGRRVISLAYPPEVTADHLEKREEKWPASQDVKSEVLLAFLEAKNLAQVDVVGHSDGGMNAVVAASKKEDRFRHFVLVTPSGLTGKESYFSIAKRGMKNASLMSEAFRSGSETERDRIRTKKQDVGKWLKGQGMIRGLIEGMDPGRFQVVEDLKALKVAGHGVSIIAGVDDVMVPMEKFQERSAVDMGVDGFYSVAGGHGKIWLDPEKYGFLASEALNALEKKYDSVEPKSPE